MTTLHEGAITLQTISLEEIPAIFGLVKDDLGLAEQMTWEVPENESEAIEIFTKLFSRNRICFGIYLDERLIGIINVQNFNWWHHDAQKASAFINFWVGTEFGDNNYEVEALRAVSRYCLENLKLKKIFSGCFTGNQTIGKALKQVGYREIGVLKKHFLKQNKPIDSTRYELLTEDFVG